MTKLPDILREQPLAATRYLQEMAELKEANWLGNGVESVMRARALLELSRGRSTDDLLALAAQFTTGSDLG